LPQICQCFSDEKEKKNDIYLFQQGGLMKTLILVVMIGLLMGCSLRQERQEPNKSLNDLEKILDSIESNLNELDEIEDGSLFNETSFQSVDDLDVVLSFFDQLSLLENIDDTRLIP
jgi:hypothetical protein